MWIANIPGGNLAVCFPKGSALEAEYQKKILVEADFSIPNGKEIFCDGVNYWFDDLPPAAPASDELKTNKISTLSTACNATITAGCDVTLSDGSTGHISMTDEDQINLMSAMSTVGTGAAGYPYHLDGALCRVYSAADILTMGTAATRHKLYHTTYCNHLLVWVRRCETAAEVEAITYGCDLPEDLAGSLEEVLTSAATI